MYGPERFFQDLDALGLPYRREVTPNGQTFGVLTDYKVLSGRFQGRVIDLGLEAVHSYPQAVASSIQVRSDPLLFDYGDTAPNVRNIIQSPLGPEWRYWSRSFQWGPDKTLDDLLAQIAMVFHHA